MSVDGFPELLIFWSWSGTLPLCIASAGSIENAGGGNDKSVWGRKPPNRVQAQSLRVSLGAKPPEAEALRNSFQRDKATFCTCFWATVCKTVHPMLSDRCPVLSVTFVYCGQTLGRIKIKLGMRVGLGPGHTELDGNPATPPPKGHSPQFSTHICCGQRPEGSRCHLVWR